MKYIARERNSEQNIITESSKTLNFLYNTLIGRIILRILINLIRNKNKWMKELLKLPLI